MLKDSPRILYIEDNPLNMTLIRKSINFMGYRLLEAANGLQGINLAINERPDLILLDLRLPDMSGEEVAARLRQHPSTRHAAIVALTSESVDDPAAWCSANGFDGFLTKPITRTTLLQTVRYWTEQSRQHLVNAGRERADGLEDTKPDLRHVRAFAQPNLTAPRSE